MRLLLTISIGECLSHLGDIVPRIYENLRGDALAQIHIEAQERRAFLLLCEKHDFLPRQLCLHLFREELLRQPHWIGNFADDRSARIVSCLRFPEGVCLLDLFV